MTERAPLRFSVLKQMAKSPAHCRYAMDHPSVPTPTMRLGTLGHAIALGKTMPVVYPGPVRRGKEFEAFKAQFPDEEAIFLESEVVTARGIAGSLMGHGEAVSLMMGRREETILWEIAGRPCRGTPDIFNTKTRTLVDLKTCADASPQKFTRSALALGYHAQLVWYRDGLAAAGFDPVDRLIIIAVENEPPYHVATYQLTDAAIDFGRRLYKGWFHAFQVCEASNEWRGYLPEMLDAPQDFALEVDGEEFEVA